MLKEVNKTKTKQKNYEMSNERQVMNRLSKSPH